MVEQRPFKALVVGSSPTQPIFLSEWRGSTSFVDLVAGTILGARRISIGGSPNTCEAKSIPRADSVSR
jgi:hypothetical protein